MREFALVVFIGLLSGSTSGVFELLVPEPCSLIETSSSSDEDGHCAPTCVRCGCCARPLQVTPAIAEARTFVVARVQSFVTPSLPTADPRDILHVPRQFPI